MSQRRKWKIQRALGLELPGLGKPRALEKRNYPPGQHGKSRKPKVSQFGAQLRENRAPHLTLPSFLQFETPEATERGVLLSVPDASHVPFEFNTNQVAEYYAKRGV